MQVRVTISSFLYCYSMAFFFNQRQWKERSLLGLR